MTPWIEARKLLQELNLCELPISMESICRSLGITVVFDRLTGIDGYFVQHPTNNVTVIVVNDSVSLLRQRFSIAHELGHIRMGHGLAGCSYVSGQFVRYPKLETNANAFASELLMPKLLLRRFGYLDPQQVAMLCRVSLETATIRVKEMGWVEGG